MYSYYIVIKVFHPLLISSSQFLSASVGLLTTSLFVIEYFSY